MSLLHHTLLEIAIVAPENVNFQNLDGKADTSDAGVSDKIIFSSVAHSRTVNPSWNNLDECIEDYLALDGYLDSETGMYRFMKIRIWLISPHEGNGRESPWAKTTKNSDENPQVRKGENPLLEINIHPTKLRRLAKIPQKLPVNSLIFHFSDGSIRASKAVLDIVGDQDGSHETEHNKDEFGRFRDDVFRTLDQVTPVKKSNSSKGEKKEKLKESIGASILTKNSTDSEDSDGPKLYLDREKRQQQELLSAIPTKFAGNQSDATMHDIDAERRHLEQLIKLEEEALEREMNELQEVRTVPGDQGIITLSCS